MKMTLLDLIKPQDHTEGFGATSLTELLWLHAEVGDGIEHLRTHLTDDGARVIFFSVTDDEEESRRSAEALCRRAISAASELQGWGLR